MFSLRSFILQGLFDAIGKMADYQVILNAVAWYEKGVLEEADLAKLQAAISNNEENTELEEALSPDDASAEEGAE